MLYEFQNKVLRMNSEGSRQLGYTAAQKFMVKKGQLRKTADLKTEKESGG